MMGCFAQPFDRRFEIGPVHVIEARRHDDARGEVIALLWQNRELGQFGQCDIHSEGCAFALPAMHAGGDIRLNRPLGDQPIKKELRIYPGNNVCRIAKLCRRQQRRRRGRR